MNMPDFFDEIIMCRDCGKKMSKAIVIKNSFKIRTLQCKNCNKRIYHPSDIEEYKRFLKLKQQPFNVKLRIVGNSYTVSIPREIINFQEQFHQEMKRTKTNSFRRTENRSDFLAKEMENMNKIVRLCLEEPGKLSLLFREEEEEE